VTENTQLAVTCKYIIGYISYIYFVSICNYYYTRLMVPFSRTTWVAVTRKVNHSGFYWSKRWWGGSGISWTICKSFASCSRQITTPVPHHSVFTGRMTYLAPASKHWRQ